MYLLQVQPGIQQQILATLTDLASAFGQLLTRRKCAQTSIVPTCEGYSWCDSLEHQMTEDMARSRRTRL